MNDFYIHTDGLENKISELESGFNKLTNYISATQMLWNSLMQIVSSDAIYSTVKSYNSELGNLVPRVTSANKKLCSFGRAHIEKSRKIESELKEKYREATEKFKSGIKQFYDAIS